MVLPELVRLLSWTSANILSAPDSSGKISSQGCLAMTRTIFSQDSANWWQHAFCCEFASISNNGNHYVSQSLTFVWLIFGSSSTPNISLATGPVLSRDLSYAWASPEYRDSLTSAGFRLSRLSKIAWSAFLHGLSGNFFPKTFPTNFFSVPFFKTFFPRTFPGKLFPETFPGNFFRGIFLETFFRRLFLEIFFRGLFPKLFTDDFFWNFLFTMFSFLNMLTYLVKTWAFCTVIFYKLQINQHFTEYNVKFIEFNTRIHTSIVNLYYLLK